MPFARNIAAAKVIAAMIAAIFRMIFGGFKEAAASLTNDVRRIGRVAKTVGERSARAVGRGLSGPARAVDLTANAVGQTFGALLPQPPVTPRAVADAAVSQDDRADRIAHAGPAIRMPDAPVLGIALQLAAASRGRGQDDIARIHLQDAAPHVVAWFGQLTPTQLFAIEKASPWALDSHVAAVSAEGRIADLPPVGAAPGAMSDAEQRAAIAAARRRMSGERSEVEAMSRHGVARPLADDGYVPAPTWTPAPRPSLH